MSSMFSGIDLFNSTLYTSRIFSEIGIVDYVPIWNWVYGTDDFDELSGGSGPDIIFGYDGSDILWGGNGNDKIYGGDGNDYIYGDSGNDKNYGGDGNDHIYGGYGNDTLYGGSDSDYLRGLDGNDWLDGGTGGPLLGDYLWGGEGNDTLIGNGYYDSLGGDNGDDFYRLSADVRLKEFSDDGTDTVETTFNYTLGDNFERLLLVGTATLGTGNSLNNLIAGNDLSNELSGLAGNDKLIGKAGNDMLVGGLGNDILTGGIGSDTLAGSEDRDQYVFDINSAFDTSLMGNDQIYEFTSGLDKIVLDKTTFTALRSATGNGFSIGQEFALVATDAAAVNSSALIVYSRVTGNLFYNPNGIADGFGSGGQFALVNNVAPLTANDFLIGA
jgi:Ca2+-binding RTX toxin-like protein